MRLLWRPQRPLDTLFTSEGLLLHHAGELRTARQNLYTETIAEGYTGTQAEYVRWISRLDQQK